MTLEHSEIIAGALSIALWQVNNTIKLLEDKATIPFISRYRKEATGSLDEVQIAAIKEQLEKLKELDKRKKTIIKTIDKQGKLTPELKNKIENTFDSNELEDIYLPYKPKRKTRASIAIENGLEPLAKIIFSQKSDNISKIADSYLDEKVENTEAALQGARDIIAEWINENPRSRNVTRNFFEREAIISSRIVKGKESEGIKYKDYFDFKEPLAKCASHRLLAIRRGSEEGFLKISVAPSGEKAVEALQKLFIPFDNKHGRRGNSESSKQVVLAIKDGYKRLLQPSIETEFNQKAKEKADKEAIKVFGENLRQLLLSSPLGHKRILAIDPGFQSGCKIVCLNEQGDLLHNENIFPHKPQQQVKQAAKKILALVNSYKIQAIGIGNGTASRETEAFIRKIKFTSEIQVFIVNESGASVYSASSVGREEFPRFDVTVRGAVSIGRRLMDPLAELVKIDPKSIGVGQYQHDVDQGELKKNLDLVVESCVNKVGVNLNTASKHLLTYISGLGPVLAKNIVEYRNENGAFQSRQQLKKVARMGVKSFEQCAGFLRIPDAKNPLDNSAVHPESYHVVEKMAKDTNASVLELLKENSLQKRIDINKYVTKETGLPTLTDIILELSKPGRDPRKTIKVFEFDKNLRTIDNLVPGMIVPGIINNITNFGAFVDIGIKQNGLIHVSQLKNEFVSNPADVVSMHQHIQVKVLEVDAERGRIQLSMKDMDD